MKARDVIRLEIEQPPNGLVNLIPNPEGQYGAWGWVTPLANTAVIEDPAGPLVFRTTVAQAAFFRSEFMPATPGLYYSGRIDGTPSAGASFNIVLEFWTADQVALSQGVTSSLVSPPGGTVFCGPAQAPANAAYVTLKVSLHGTTATSNPSANSSVTYTRAMVTYTSTATAQTERHNLMPNGSFEASLTGWSAGLNCGGIARVTDAGSPSGTAYMQGSLASTGASDRGYINGPKISGITPGKPYAVQARLASFSGYIAAGGYLLRWFDSTGTTQVGDDIVKSVDLASGWALVSGIHFAPPKAARLQVFVFGQNIGGRGGGILEGRFFGADAIMVEQSSQVGFYFNGATTMSGWVFSWDGTAGNSPSTAKTTPGTFDYVAEATYVDVLADSNNLTWTRSEMNPGTLSALIISDDLDPAVAGTIQTGQRCRVMAFVPPASGTGPSTWQPLFTGTLGPATVTYDLLNGRVGRRAQINLSATDPMSGLAGVSRKYGVRSIDDLPWVLEGAGQPWNCNGSGDQVLTATPASFNDNASAADQVALTRDSSLGYAWMDRRGVLQVWDRSQIATTAWTFDENVYSPSIEVGYDAAAIINSVTITLQQYDPVTGASGEKSLGPYRDAASIRRVRREYSQSFTVAGLSEAECENLANAILATNATPVRRVTALSVPLTHGDGDLLPYAAVDLYDTAHVTNLRAAIDENHRVLSITHTLQVLPNPDATTRFTWQMDLGFSGEDSVALPTLLPDSTVAELRAEGQMVTYTPTWTAATTNPTLSNGTLTGGYHLDGQGWCEVEIDLTIGSSTNLGAGVYTFSLPPALDLPPSRVLTGLLTAGGAPYVIFARRVGPGLLRLSYTSTNGLQFGVSGTAPASLAAGDTIALAGRFRVA